jgi:hypothetical protein
LLNFENLNGGKMSAADSEKEAKRAEFLKLIETCGETMLYLIIESLGGMQWTLRHQANKSYTSDSEAAVMLHDSALITIDLGLAVQQTVRFGVSKPTDEEGIATPEYWRWYRWWNGYHKGMTENEWQRLDCASSGGEDLSGFRPSGDWRVAEGAI